MVLSILSLLTRPCLMRRRFSRSTVLGCSMTIILSLSKDGDSLLGDRGLNLGVGSADELDPREVAQMPGPQREPQVEELFLGLASALLEVRHGQLAQGAQVVAFHYDATSASWSARVTILVAIGSL